MIIKYTCEEMQEMLSLYLDDMLEGDEVSNVKQHLSTCQNCNAEYLELVKIKRLLNEINDAPVPKIFERRFSKALRKEKLRRNRVRFKKIVSVVAILMVGLVSYLALDSINIFDKGKEQQIPQTASVQDEKTGTGEDKATAPKKSDVKEKEKEAEDAAALKAQEEQLAKEKEKLEAEAAEKAKADAEAKKKKEEEEKAQALKKSIADAEAKKRKLEADAKAKADVDAKAATEATSSSSNYTSNTAADNDVAQYWELIHQQFYNENYKINSYSQKSTGEWEFNINIIDKNDNTTVEKKVVVTGQDGMITVW